MRRLSPTTLLAATLGLLAIVVVRGAWQSRYTASTTAGELTLTQDSPPATVAPGAVLTYTVTTRNIGTATVTRIVTSPVVPTGLTYLPGQSNPHCSLYSGVVYCRSDDNASGYTLAAGASKSFVVAYSVPATQACGSPITHSVAAQSLQTSPAPPSAVWSMVTTTVTCGTSSSSAASSTPASSATSLSSAGGSAQSSAASTGAGELVLTQDSPPATIAPRDTLTYTITTRNTGTATATRIVASTFVPTGLTFRRALSSPSCTESSGVIYCRSDDNQTGFTLAPGEFRSFQVSYSVPASQACSSTITHSAVVQSLQTSPPPDVDTSNNRVVVTTTVVCEFSSSSPASSSRRSSSSVVSSSRRSSSVQSSSASSGVADLVLSLDSPPTTVPQGGTIAFNMTARNVGSADAAEIVVSNYPNYPIWTFLPEQSDAACMEIFSPGSISCGIDDLGSGFALRPGESRSFRMSFALPPSICGSINYNAVITSYPLDQNTLNNSASATTTVTCRSSSSSSSASSSPFVVIQGVSGPTTVIDCHTQSVAPPQWTIHATDTAGGELTYAFRWDGGSGNPPASAFTKDATQAHAYCFDTGNNSIRTEHHAAQFFAKNSRGEIASRSLDIAVTNDIHAYACFDSDGWNFWFQGTTSTTAYHGQEEETKRDYCLDDHTLIEYTCDGDVIVPVSHACLLRCTVMGSGWGLGCEEGLKVETPAGVLKPGDTYPITWLYEGNHADPGVVAEFYLLKGPSRIWAIGDTNTTIKGGSYNWTIPSGSGLPAGNDYRFLVLGHDSGGGQGPSAQSESFSIKPDKHILVNIENATSDGFKPDDTLNITWSSAGFAAGDKATIVLLAGGDFYVIANTVPVNQGSYSFTLPGFAVKDIYKNYSIWIGEYPVRGWEQVGVPPIMKGRWSQYGTAIGDPEGPQSPNCTGCPPIDACRDTWGEAYFKISPAPACTDSNWTYLLSPSACPSSGQQTKTWTSIGSCTGGVTHPATETVICYQAPTCTPNWQTGSWGVCTNGSQTRTVTDLNNCGVTTDKPETTQSCSTTCTPNWSCGSWSVCKNNNQTRTCTDLNKCKLAKLATGKPAETQSCTPCVSDWICSSWLRRWALNQQWYTRFCKDLNNCVPAINEPKTRATLNDPLLYDLPVFTSPKNRAILARGQTYQITWKYPDSSHNPLERGKIDISIYDGKNNAWSIGSAPASQGFYNWTIPLAGMSVGVRQSDRTEYNLTFGNSFTNAIKITVMDKPFCTPDWSCTNWSECKNGSETRICTDKNKCGVLTGKPDEEQSCIAGCIPNWSCSSWSDCANDRQTRTCSDLNGCQTTFKKPDESQLCPCIHFGGEDYYTFGSIITTVGGAPDDSSSLGDICRDDVVLKKAYCLPNGRSATRQIVCSQGCYALAAAYAGTCYGTCALEWNCGSWGVCANGQQIRTCINVNRCGPDRIEVQSCAASTVASGASFYSAPVPVCHNGVLESGEQCDDGNTANGDGCSTTCTAETGWTCNGQPSSCVTICGDGLRLGNEQCDDGNTAANDDCSATCITEFCGDGMQQINEQCDSGSGNSNTAPGACRTNCTLPRCGDSVMDPGEACDDGNTVNIDNCTTTCALPSCGDSFVQAGEQCDYGNQNSNNGACLLSCMNASCRDGFIKTGVEQCDDRNATAGDGCSRTCTAETGWTCLGEPSQCATACGDGMIAGNEICDDGNTNSGDGCSGSSAAAPCTIESGWTCTTSCQPQAAESHWFSFQSIFASIFSFFTGEPPAPAQVAETCHSVCTRQQSSSSPQSSSAASSSLSSSAASSATSHPAGADLAMAQDAPPSTVAPGATLTYTTTVRNDGSTDATRVIVGTLVPTGLTFLPAQSDPDCFLSRNIVYCWNAASRTGFTLRPGELRSFRLSYAVPSSQACQSSIVHAVITQGSPADQNTSNNYSRVTTRVEC